MIIARNTTDERMRRLAAAGGVMFMNTVFVGVSDNSDARSAIERPAGTLGQPHAGRAPPAARRPRRARCAPARAPPPPSTCSWRSLLHSVRVMGVDHVGLGADWDGGGGVTGMEDITLLPRITARLRREGMSERDIAKIMGGNLLRVMRQVQAGAAR